MMRQSLISIAVLTASLSLFNTSTAQATHGYYLRASIGRSSHMDGLNRWMAGPGGEYGWKNDRFPTSALSVSGGLGKFIFENIALGARLNYQDADLEIETGGQNIWQVLFGGGTPRRQRKCDTDIYEAMINVSVWIPRQSGFFAGCGAGISRCTIDLEYDENPRYRWNSSGPVFELFSGFQVTWENEFMLFSRFGYAVRDFGAVEGRRAIEGFEAMDMDFSGWFVEIGFGGHTRRPWYPPR